MGLSGSKAFLSVKETQQLLGDEYPVVVNGFNQMCVGNALDFVRFQRMVLGAFPGMPQALVDRFYRTFCGQYNQTIEVNEFTCCVAAMCRGTHEIRAKILFLLYDSQSRGYLQRERLEHFLDVIYGSNTVGRPSPSVGHEQANAWDLDPIFQGHASIQAEEFIDRVQFGVQHPVTNWFELVSATILEPPDRHVNELNNYFNPKLDEPAIAEKYGLTTSQVARLEQRYYEQLRKGGTLQTRVYPLSAWLEVTLPWIPARVSERVFRTASDHTRSGWTVCDFVDTLLLFVRGDEFERVAFFVSMFDSDKDGTLSESEVKEMLDLIHEHLDYRTNRMLSSSDDKKAFVGEEVSAKDVVVSFGFLSDSGDLMVSVDGVRAWMLQNTQRQQLLTDLSMIAASEFGVRPADPFQEWCVIIALMNQYQAAHPSPPGSNFGEEGTTWNLISTHWWSKWKLTTQGAPGLANRADRVAQAKAQEPAFISNTSLLKKGSIHQLLPNLVAGLDYEVIAPPVWNALSRWYGGSPPIQRKVISVDDKPELELYPAWFRVTVCDKNGKPRSMEKEVMITRYATVQSLQEVICSMYNCDLQSTRLWNYASNKLKDQDVLSPQRTLRESLLRQGQLLVLEVSQADGSWPRSQLQSDAEDSGTSVDRASISGGETAAAIEPVGDGLVGLFNLGNTCYLNASLQCLSHTHLLTQYFLSKAYLRDINTSNVLGHQGRLAQAYAAIIQQIWSSKRKTINPRAFKGAISKMNEQFAGNDQHDAQELLSFLLSGLSEDLNRIEEKPYIEQPDSDGRPDRELADIWWQNHLKRELSIIVALFTGQYKSTLTCAQCGYESARFEPFTFLQLPLPEDDFRTLNIILVCASGSLPPIKYSIRVKKLAVLRDVRAALVKTAAGNEDDEESEPTEKPSRRKVPKLNLVEESLLFVELHHNYIASLSSLDQPITRISETTHLHVYELDPALTPGPVVSPQPEQESEQESEQEQSLPAEDVPTTGSPLPPPSQEPLPPPPLQKIIASQLEPFGYVTNPETQLLTFVNRSTDYVDKHFINPFRIHLFGVPFVARIPNESTGTKVYDLIFNRMKRHFTGSQLLRVKESSNSAEAFKSLCPVQPSASTGSSDLYHITNSQDVHAGAVPRYGFRLRVVSTDGLHDDSKHWLDRTVGRLIPADDSPVDLVDGSTIAIDWHMAVLKGNLNDDWNDVELHQSMRQNAKNRDRKLTLAKCLDSFTTEEKMADAYCSKCKELRDATHKTEFWRLPPILVVHLKRFQFTSYSRRKLHNLVVFPTDNLDLSAYVVKDPCDKKPAAPGESGEPVSTSKGDGLKAEESAAEDEDDSKSSPDIDGELNASNGRSEGEYELYAVVHHLGAMSAGHYVSCVKVRSTGQWKCFNDNVQLDASEKDLVSDSAYILFYIRKDMADMNIEDVYPMASGEGAIPNGEEFENLMRKRDSGRCEVM